MTRTVYAGQGRTRVSEGRVLSPYAGDFYVKVRLKRDGGGATKNVHQLVAEAFLGPCPDGLEILHGPGGQHDNRVGNLRYDTHSINQFEMVANGGSQWARRTHCLRGHEYTPDNLTPDTTRRRCKQCEADRGKRRWAAKLAAREGGSDVA